MKNNFTGEELIEMYLLEHPEDLPNTRFRDVPGEDTPQITTTGPATRRFVNWLFKHDYLTKEKHAWMVAALDRHEARVTQMQEEQDSAQA